MGKSSKRKPKNSIDSEDQEDVKKSKKSQRKEAAKAKKEKALKKELAKKKEKSKKKEKTLKKEKSSKKPKKNEEEDTLPVKRRRLSSGSAEPKKKRKQSNEGPIIQNIRKPTEETQQLSQNYTLILFGGLPETLSAKRLLSHLSQYGQITHIFMFVNDLDIFRGLALVNFADQTSATRALSFDGRSKYDRVLKISRVFPVQSKPSGGSASIFVGDLSFNTTEASIRSFFSGCGTIKKVKLPLNDDGTPKGFCHVDFYNPRNADLAMNMKGRKLDGRTVRLDYSK